MPQPYLVITSWPDLDGARLQARHWVQNKLAASVNILPQMDSIYVWQGELRSGREHKMFIKTSANRLEALQQEIESAHPWPTYLTVLRREGVAKTLWRAARTRGPRRRSLLYVKRADGSTALHSALCGVRTTAWMQEVEQRMEQLPSRKSVRYAGQAVAEILQFKIDSGNREYLDWIRLSTQ